MRKQAAPPQSPTCAQAQPDSQGVLHQAGTARWDVTGQGTAAVLLLGADAQSQEWKLAMANWSQHFQVLTPRLAHGCAQDDCERVQALLTDLNTHFAKQPIYVLGLHSGCALACQLAPLLPQLSGLVLLNAARHGCMQLCGVPSTDMASSSCHWTQLDVPILTIWQQAPHQVDPTEAAIALAQGHEQHEWMVMPTSSDHHTTSQIILRWLQSHA